MCIKFEVINDNTSTVIEKSNSDVNDMLDRKYELSLLYDYYGVLLKENIKNIFEAYILDDMSLSEIAAEQSISRQAVHESVKRATKTLTEYEQKLGLISKGAMIRDYLEQVSNIVSGTDNCDKVTNILEKISEEV